MTHKYFPYYDSGNNIFIILFSAWYFFRYNDFLDSLFLCKAFYLDSTDVQIEILIVVDFVFPTTPESFFINIVAWFKENRLFLYFRSN